MFNLTYNALALAPIENPRNALDVGTGTGIWAVDFGESSEQCTVHVGMLTTIPADQHPNCEVCDIVVLIVKTTINLHSRSLE